MIWTPKKRDLIVPRRFKRAEPPQRGRCDLAGIVNPYFSAPVFSYDAVDFDGVNDFMTRTGALTGQADSKTGIFSCWFRCGTVTGKKVFVGNDTGVNGRVVEIATSQVDATHWLFDILVQNSAATILHMSSSTGSPLLLNTWYHILASWDVATLTTHFYVNGASSKTNSEVTTNTTIPYASIDNWYIGADEAGGNKMTAAITEVYFAPGQYLDFSVAGNRDKFILSSKPVSLGTTGNTPTGSTPITYNHIDAAEAPANFATNRAGAGNWTITGTLTTAGTKP